MRKQISKWLCIAACSMPLTGFAQQPIDKVSANCYFNEGQEQFRLQNFAAALSPLEMYLYLCPEGTYRMEADYMLACSAYELKDERRIDMLRAFLKKYPETPDSNRIYALLAAAYYEAGDNDQALALFNSVRMDRLPDLERDRMTYLQARAHLKAGQLTDAAIWFETLKESSRSYHRESCYYLAYIRYAQGRLPEALQGFRLLQEDTEWGRLSDYYVTEIQLRTGNYEEAESVARNFLKRYPNDEHVTEMKRMLGESLYRKGNFAGAAQYLADYCSETPDSRRDADYMLGMAYFHTGVYSKAVSILGKVTTVQDALAQNAYYHMGLSNLQLAEKNKARLAFGQASRMEGDASIRELAAYNYALCLHETDFSAFGESVTAFENFLNDYPSSVYAAQVSGYLVDVYMSTRSYDAALKSIERIAYPDNRILEAKQRILFQLGTERMANADFKEAERLFGEAIGLGKYNRKTMAAAYYWKGEACYRQQRLSDARRDFTSFLQLNTDAGEMTALAYYNLGYIDFQTGMYERAKTEFINYVRKTSGENTRLQADASNRIADCCFKVRNWEEAKHYYAEAQRLDAALGDYAFYQLAVVAGLQNDYSGKITWLNRLVGKYPKSSYLVSALYEKARAYVQLENREKAIASFKELLAGYPESPVARKAAAEIGLLYYQAGEYEQAIAAYKQVVSKYPGSEEARMAMLDLKSVYVDMNRVDEFAAWVTQLPGHVGFDATEQDSLTYIAAEKIYMKGRLEEAKASMQRYLVSYPSGAFTLNANYYLCAIASKQKRYDEVLSYSDVLMNYLDSPYAQEALVMRGDVLFNQGRLEEALQTYKIMKEKAVGVERRLLAETYILRCASLLKDDVEIIRAAGDLLAESNLEPELRNEALYDRSKAYLRQNALAKAQADWRLLATDTRNVYGAEARYRLAQSFFDAGEYAKAEQELLDYIDQSTPHMYWLARSFVLLADVYMATGKEVDARQYLLSLQQNYQADDDIARMIESRLEKLNSNN